MMTLMAFMITIGILVTIHEFGHFQVARWCGIRVLCFSIGFGKPLWKKTIGKGQTEFVLAAIPLGGYVKMLDERELAEVQEDPNNKEPIVHYTEAELKSAFNRKTVYQRIAVVLAGPVANLLLAILLYWLLFLMGVTGIKPILGDITEKSAASFAQLKKNDVITKIEGKPVATWQQARWELLDQSLSAPSVTIETSSADQQLHTHTLLFSGINMDSEEDILSKLGLSMLKPVAPPIIGDIIAGSVADKAGFSKLDKVIAINQTSVADWEAVVKIVQASPNIPLEFQLMRNSKALTMQATPEAVHENGKTIGRLGASVKLDAKQFDWLLIDVHYSVSEALHEAVIKTWQTAILSLKMLKNMILGQSSWKSISGPVSIANYAGESANLGIKVFISFLAVVSISIGVLNLLPIPMLDGGHLMYYIVEIFKGSPVSEQVMMAGQKIGMGILGLLMVVALFNDINRYMIG